MKAKYKKVWIDKLLSGDYAQGDGYLSVIPNCGDKDNTYCCLGVLRECLPADYQDRSEDGNNQLLDEETEKLVGLNYDIQEELATLDEDGVPFDMIAGLIKEAL